MGTPISQWIDLIKIDPVGPGLGTSFDDTPATLDAIEPITKLVVRSGQWIDRLTIYYGDKYFSHGGDGGDDNTIDIDPGDFIVEVSGYYRDQYIMQLSFRTKNEIEFGPYGGNLESGWASFSFEARNNEAIVAFCGSIDNPIPSGVYLRSIGIAVATFK